MWISHPPDSDGLGVSQLRGGWARPRRGSPRSFEPVLQHATPQERGELVALIGLAGVLNLWGLSVNGWANTYYSAAVRSMSTSWHDFLFASMDKSGLMTVDKPPLSLWVQALSVRVFGFHPLSILVPQALMGVAAAGLVYDLTRGASEQRSYSRLFVMPGSKACDHADRGGGLAAQQPG